MAKVPKEIEPARRTFFQWFFDVRPIIGASNYLYINLFMIFIQLAIIGFQFGVIKTYFEIMVMFGLTIIMIRWLDIILSQSDNGFFSVFNWLSVFLFIIYIINKDYHYPIMIKLFVVLFFIGVGIKIWRYKL
jgi:hypothetical protein